MDKNQYKEVCGAFTKLKTVPKARMFLEDLLTPQERASVAERFQIFKLLAKGKTQRDIAKQLHVSISKVIRGAHAWRTSKGGVRTVLK